MYILSYSFASVISIYPRINRGTLWEIILDRKRKNLQVFFRNETFIFKITLSSFLNTMQIHSAESASSLVNISEERKITMVCNLISPGHSGTKLDIPQSKFILDGSS